MSITHEKARDLIHLKADRLLPPRDLPLLDSHLAACPACAAYAGQIERVEADLRRTMRKHWNASPLPLPVPVVQGSHLLQGWARLFVPTRKAWIGVTIMLFVFTLWQAAISGNGSPVLLYEVSPNPTPSLFFTVVQNDFEACNRTHYVVQPGDTLESLAERFAIPVEALSSLNQLERNHLEPGTDLIIPLCTLTPTSTTHPPTSTLTPGFQTFTLPPG